MRTKIFFISLITVFLLVGSLLAGGVARIVVNDNIIEAGEEIGAYLVLDGDGTYDVYAALTGGVLGSQIFLFTESGSLVPFNGDISSLQNLKLRSNLDFSSLGVREKIIQLLPKVPLDDTSQIKGTYTFIVALCTPGKLDFVYVDQTQIEIR